MCIRDRRNEEIAMIENINKNAVLFRDSNVTKALSLAIDRNAIAEAVVFAKAANALVPYGLYEAESAKKSFRAVGGKLIETSADVNAAKSLLSAYNTADYTINITVAEYDEVHMLTVSYTHLSAYARLLRFPDFEIKEKTRRFTCQVLNKIFEKHIIRA